MSAYDKVVSEAVSDFLDRGYQSPEQLAHWVLRIREAANALLAPDETARRGLSETLESAYRRLVDNMGVVRFHPGLPRHVVERIRPSLRLALDRRLVAAHALSGVSREEAINRVVRRFIGWATSVPAGGSDEPKSSAKEPFSDLSLASRRLALDQQAKLVSDISSTIADEAGALAGLWRSNWQQPGYDYREDHRDRDRQIYLKRGSWALREGLLRKAGEPYLEEIEAPGEWPFCRCWLVYLYDLREIPAKFLTVRGRAALVEAGKRR